MACGAGRVPFQILRDGAPRLLRMETIVRLQVFVIARLQRSRGDPECSRSSATDWIAASAFSLLAMTILRFS